MSLLTTIFTGHTIRLTDIRAVSGVMIETKRNAPFYHRTLYIEITLADTTNLIRFDQHRYEGVNGIDANPKEQEKWHEQTQQLITSRDVLVEQWEKALEYYADAQTTA